MKRTVEALGAETFDLLILGGGITGAGVALDAVLRGFRVALIEKGDFASGTSSVSSKLIHGGLRYLEHGGFHLVYEALRERQLLLQNAPHLVRPLRFVIPFYENARVPPWKWRAGLTFYDLLAAGRKLRRSRPVRLNHLEHEFPRLRNWGLIGAADYFDAQMDDARLCLEVIHSAALAGAVTTNYVEAVAFERRNGIIAGVRAVDRVTGTELAIQARQVVNATGPWVDAVRRLAGDDASSCLRPTKGVHVTIPDLGLTAAFLLLHPADSRVFFVIPWMGKTLVGTTDTLCDESPDQLMVTDEEVCYLLEGYNHHFTPGLKPADVLNSFVGLRPLIRSRSGEPAGMTREFQLFSSPSGLLSVAGGKYTTYRSMAEVVTDTIAGRLGQRRRCLTRQFRLFGVPNGSWAEFEAGAVRSLCASYGIDEGSARHLVRRYGQHAAEVAAYVERDRGLANPIVPGEPDIQAELAYQRDQEATLYPADHFLRRTRLGLFHPELLKAT